MAGDYPKRPKFFACRFCRVMAKVCLANEIGPEACWLLTVIAQTEDAKGYRDAVTFFNGQLMAFAGSKTVKALDRVRAKAIAAGWLHYQPGAKGKAGRYWVEIPERHRDWDDAPSDEWAGKYPFGSGDRADYSESNSTTQPPHNRHESGEETATNPPHNRHESGQHSSLTLTRTQEKNPPTPKGGEPADRPTTLFDRFWAAYPRRAGKPKACAAFLKHKPTEALLAAMLAALEWQRESEQWTKDGGQFIPHPATWLNQKRWEDERPPTVTTSPPQARLDPVTAMALRTLPRITDAHLESHHEQPREGGPCAIAGHRPEDDRAGGH